MENFEQLKIVERLKVVETLRFDVASLLEELVSFDDGLLIICDDELNPVVEQPMKSSKLISDALPLSRTTLHQLIDMAGSGPVEIDERVSSLIGLNDSLSGVLVPLNYPNIRGILLIVFKNRRVLTDKELGCINSIASALSKYYGILMELLIRTVIANNVLDSLDIGIYTISKSGIMVQLNQAAEKLFGYNAKSIIGRHYLECTALQARDVLKRIINYVMEKKKIYSEENISFVTLNDEELVLSSTIYPLLDEEGELLGVVGLVQDETGKRSFQNKIIQLEKMTVMNQIATNVTHEVQGPLSAIRGFARMIEKKESIDASSKRFAQIIINEVDRINNIVTRLLDFSRPMEIDLSPVNLNEIINEVCKMIFNQETGINLNLYLDENLPLIRGQHEKLSELFINLLMNSIEAVGPTGVIEIATDFSGEKVRVNIQDNGYGISKSIQEKIFDPYFSTKTNGAGIGLAIARQITTSHNGQIKVISREGQGTTFILDFPVTREVG